MSKAKIYFFVLLVLSLSKPSSSIEVVSSGRPLQNYSEAHVEFVSTKPLMDFDQFSICLKFKTFQFESPNYDWPFGGVISLSNLSPKFGSWTTKNMSNSIKDYVKSKTQGKWKHGKKSCQIIKQFKF